VFFPKYAVSAEIHWGTLPAENDINVNLNILLSKNKCNFMVLLMHYFECVSKIHIMFQEDAQIYEFTQNLKGYINIESFLYMLYVLLYHRIKLRR
jgi:hypothetical protein